MHTDKTHEHSQLAHTSLLLTVGLSTKVFQSWSVSRAKMWGRESALLGEVLNTPPFSQSSFIWHTLRATM
jgi:hypothetical protein